MSMGTISVKAVVQCKSACKVNMKNSGEVGAVQVTAHTSEKAVIIWPLRAPKTCVHDCMYVRLWTCISLHYLFLFSPMADKTALLLDCVSPLRPNVAQPTSPVALRVCSSQAIEGYGQRVECSSS